MNKKIYVTPLVEVEELHGEVTMDATSWTVTGNGQQVNDDDIIKIIEGDPDGGLSVKGRSNGWDQPVENSLW